MHYLDKRLRILATVSLVLISRDYRSTTLSTDEVFIDEGKSDDACLVDYRISRANPDAECYQAQRIFSGLVPKRGTLRTGPLRR